MFEFEPRYLRHAIKFLVVGAFLAYGLIRHLSIFRVRQSLPLSKLNNLPVGLVRVKGRSQSEVEYTAPLSKQTADMFLIEFSYPLLGAWIPSIARAYFSGWYLVDGDRRVLLDPGSVSLTAKSSYSKYVWPWNREFKARCRSILGPGERLPFFFFHAEETIVKAGEEIEVVGTSMPTTHQTSTAVIADSEASGCYVFSLENKPSKWLVYLLSTLSVVFFSFGAFLLAGVVLKIQSVFSALVLFSLILIALGALTYSIIKGYK